MFLHCKEHKKSGKYSMFYKRQRCEANIKPEMLYEQVGKETVKFSWKHPEEKMIMESDN